MIIFHKSESERNTVMENYRVLLSSTGILPRGDDGPSEMTFVKRGWI